MKQPIYLKQYGKDEILNKKTAFFKQIQGFPFKEIPKIHSNYVAYYWEKSIIYDENIMIWSKKFQQAIIQCKAKIKG